MVTALTVNGYWSTKPFVVMWAPVTSIHTAEAKAEDKGSALRHSWKEHLEDEFTAPRFNTHSGLLCSFSHSVVEPCVVLAIP